MLLAEDLVDHAAARPEHQVPPGLLGQVRAQVLVGGEDDRLVLGDRLDDLDRVAARAAIVAHGLQLQAGVDVGDHHVVGVLLAPGPEHRRRAAIDQRAAGCAIREDHRPVRVEDLGGLGHEPDPAEHDHVLLALGRLARERQAVAHEVGDVLNVGVLVVVRQDHGVALFAEALDLELEVVADRRSSWGLLAAGSP